MAPVTDMLVAIAMEIESLVREYGDRIYNLAYKMTGDAGEAEDIVQETFLQAHRYLDRFRGESSAYTWLYRIALNIALRAKERLAKGFFESLLAEIQRACVHFITRKLTDEQRAVYVLRVMVGLPLDDVSQVLELPKNTVKARLHRAKVALREYFSGRCQWAADSATCSCESKLGFAIASAPDILQKLRDHPPDDQALAIIRTTVHDVTSPEAIRALYPERSLAEQTIQRILAS